MSAKNKPGSVVTALLNPGLPIEQRRMMLGQLCINDSPECIAAVTSLLEAAGAAKAESVHAEKLKALEELLQQMEAGPLRPATFLGLLQGRGNVARARVLLEDGATAYVVVPDEELAKSLRRGDAVLLEAQGKALLDRDPAGVDVGEEARLERALDGGRVEVTLRDHERHVFRTAADLAEELDRKDVSPGGMLLVCARRGMAFASVPNADGLSHYRYLIRSRPPETSIQRDIGNPPPFLEELTDHVRREMTDPELGRRYRLRRAVMKLLTGVSGSGKTLCVQGFWRKMYEVMSEITGVPMEDLPPRVVRLRMSEVLSKWLGDSDKHIDLFFDEVDQLADERFEGPDGRRHEMPLLAICEECDGLARARGDDAIHDRIQTTLLQRLDVTCQKLRDRLVIFLFTTNVPQVVDPAFLRRAGGTTERFGRLNRRGFVAVLNKHLRDLPLLGGDDATEAQRNVVHDVVAWLFSPNGNDRGQVELTFAGSTQPMTKHRRDFLNGALVDRAVQEAATEACRAERQGTDRPGLTAASLVAAFDRQVRSVVDQLHPHNVTNYLDLPDGVRVVNVRRIDQPTVLPMTLERAS